MAPGKPAQQLAEPSQGYGAHPVCPPAWRISHRAPRPCRSPRCQSPPQWGPHPPSCRLPTHLSARQKGPRPRSAKVLAGSRPRTPDPTLSMTKPLPSKRSPFERPQCRSSPNQPPRRCRLARESPQGSTRTPMLPRSALGTERGLQITSHLSGYFEPENLSPNDVQTQYTTRGF